MKTEKDNRSDITQRIRNRDPEALKSVVQAYLPQVFRAARALGFHSGEAEDLVQSTFLTFFEAAPRFEGRSHVRTFLFGILYKKIAEARRQLSREHRMAPIEEVREEHFQPDGTWVHPPRAPEECVQALEDRERFMDCIEALPVNQRMAFVLREITGLETDDICKILDINRTNLGVLLFRARAHLRGCLEKKDRSASSRPRPL
jgi:RNA polymerase sigma-70 factor (ECF subfamily)